MARNSYYKYFPKSYEAKLDKGIYGGDSVVDKQIYSEYFNSRHFPTKMIGGPIWCELENINKFVVLHSMRWDSWEGYNNKLRKQFEARWNSRIRLNYKFPTYGDLTKVAIKHNKMAFLKKDPNLKNVKLAVLGVCRGYTFLAWYPTLETAEKVREMFNSDDIVEKYTQSPVDPTKRANYGDFFLKEEEFEIGRMRYEAGNDGIVPPNDPIVPIEENEANQINQDNLVNVVNVVNVVNQVNEANQINEAIGAPQEQVVNPNDDDNFNINHQTDQPHFEQANLPGPVQNSQSVRNKRPNGEFINNKDDNNKKKRNKYSSDGSIRAEFDFGPSTSKQQQPSQHQQQQQPQPQTGNPSNQALEHSSQMMMNSVQVPNSINMPQAHPEHNEIMNAFMVRNDLACEIGSHMWNLINLIINVFTNKSVYLPLAKSEQNAICLVCERSGPNDEIVSCQLCTASAHSKCYPRKMIKDPNNGKFTCEACDFAPFWEVGCAICGKADGGVYRRYLDGYDIWVHAIYMLFVGFQLLPNSYCCYCKQEATFTTAACSQPECANTFHPCCAAKDGNIQPIADNRWEGICNQHSDVSLQLTQNRMQEFGESEVIITRRIQKQKDVVKKLNFALVLPISIVHEFVTCIQKQPVTGFKFTKSFFVNVLKCWVAAKKSVGGDNIQKVGLKQLGPCGSDRMSNAIKCQAEKRSRRLTYPQGYDPFLDFSAQDIFLRALVNLEETGVAKFGDHHFADAEPIESSIRRSDESELSGNIDDSGNGQDEDDTEEEKADDEETEVENS